MANIPKAVYLVEIFPDETKITQCPTPEIAGRLAGESTAPKGLITRDPEGKDYIHRWPEVDDEFGWAMRELKDD